MASKKALAKAAKEINDLLFDEDDEQRIDLKASAEKITEGLEEALGFKDDPCVISDEDRDGLSKSTAAVLEEIEAEADAQEDDENEDNEEDTNNKDDSEEAEPEDKEEDIRIDELKAFCEAWDIKIPKKATVANLTKIIKKQDWSDDAKCDDGDKAILTKLGIISGEDNLQEEKEEKLPKAKTEKKDKKKAPKTDKTEKKGKRGRKGSGIGVFVRKQLSTKKGWKRSNEDILEDVLAKFPEANTTKGNIGWYRNAMKKDDTAPM